MYGTAPFINSMQTRGIVQTSRDLQAVFVKIGDFIKFKGFSCGILREQVLLRKSNTPKIAGNVVFFLRLAFYNVPSLHSVDFIMI